MDKRILGLLPFRCLLFPLCFGAASILFDKSLDDLSKWWALFAVGINVVCIILLCAVNKGDYKGFINYEKGKTKIKLVVAVVVLTLVVGMSGMYAAGYLCYGEFPYLDVKMIQPLPIFAAVLCVVFLPLSTTLAEDGIYLGVINKSNGNTGVTFMSAFFYAAQHSFIPLLPDGQFMLYRFISFLPLTLLFCFWYRKIRNPLPFMAGHFVINLSTVAMLLITAISPDTFETIKI